jgi:hypothetical protein
VQCYPAISACSCLLRSTSPYFRKHTLMLAYLPFLCRTSHNMLIQPALRRIARRSTPSVCSCLTFSTSASPRQSDLSTTRPINVPDPNVAPLPIRTIEAPRKESDAVRTLDRLASALRKEQDGSAKVKLSRLRGGSVFVRLSRDT